MSANRNSIYLGLSGLVLVLVLIVAHKAQEMKPSCQAEYRLDTTILVGEKTLRAEIANEPEAQVVGLSGRDCIPEEVGMLFSFQEQGRYPFWMKDMLFPIDIVWMDSDRQVVTVTQNVQPSSYPKTFTSSSPAQYVLEIKADTAYGLGLRPGRTPLF